jgi:DNA-binding transcriptional MocR family regulator
MTNRSTSPEVAVSTSGPEPGRRAGRVLDDLGDWSAGSGPIYRRLARALAGAVERGTLPAGARLPSERALARRLQLSRGTVLAAYDGLAAEGLIERRHGSGTYVAAPGSTTTTGSALPPDREGGSLVHHLTEAGGTSPAPAHLVDLSLSVVASADHLPLPRLTPAALRRAEPATGYAPWGLRELREVLARRLTADGMATHPDQVVVTSGAQQALAVAAACWVRPGDTVVCEDPAYPGALAAFRQAGARLVGVPVDDHGVVVEALAGALQAAPALVYLQPDVHSPTGAVLAERRRRAVADLVRSARVPLVEDRALADTAWSRPPAPIAAAVPRHSIALVGSLSKSLWGGLRLGWLRAPEPLAQRLVRVKATMDLGSSVPSQLLATALLTDPDIEEVLRRRRRTLRARTEHLAGALREHVPGWRWRMPAGGLSLWVRLPGGADGDAFARVAGQAGVAVAGPAGLTVDGGPDDHVRLAVDLPEPVLDLAAARLGEAWRRWPETR